MSDINLSQSMTPDVNKVAQTLISKHVLTAKDGVVKTTSLQIAEYFDKQHRNVLQSIQYLDCSKEFTQLNFQLSEYTDNTGRKLPMYEVTKDGFVFLVMGYRGKKAALFKEAYIQAFNLMQNQFAQDPQTAPTSFALKEQVELEFVVATQAAALLRMDESSKLLMTRQICESHGLSPKFLPGYVDEMSTKALTVLLKEHAYDLSARRVNEALLELGLLEVKTRPSTKTEGKIKKFKSLTEAGLRFGKNLISPQNPKETQPHFFDNAELFDELMGLVQAHLDKKPELRLILGGAA
jgi:Rha family phage regulatory protein